MKTCSNCPLPFWRDITLREFMDEIAHKTKFDMNDNLYKNQDVLREEQNNSNSDSEESKGSINP